MIFVISEIWERLRYWLKLCPSADCRHVPHSMRQSPALSDEVVTQDRILMIYMVREDQTGQSLVRTTKGT